MSGAGPRAVAGPTTSMNHDHSPPSTASSLAVKSSIASAVVSNRSFSSRPARAARRLASPTGPIPANQSRPGESYGAGPETSTTATTRSASRAPQATACEPPLEWPSTANRSRPSASATAATSVATDPTLRPGHGVDPP